jgi:high-affinity Fe2+/Pb2+ permease
MKHNFWSRLGGIILLITLMICLFFGFRRVPWVWIIGLIPSFLLGFYLYRIINKAYDKSEFIIKKYLFLLASFITLSIVYYLGVFLNIIIGI